MTLHGTTSQKMGLFSSCALYLSSCCLDEMSHENVDIVHLITVNVVELHSQAFKCHMSKSLQKSRYFFSLFCDTRNGA
jgi:hypothetical protein